ncbi:MAG TPA: hypothetical protein VHF47_10960 [Acidimicrobiales bacterium]|nr:hypothetical protein [Acidimicrobiales bacterium]
MRRLIAATTVLVAAWFAVWLVPGAGAEEPEATGWWAATRVTPISQSVPQPADVVPDTIPRSGNSGGTAIPQPPTVQQLPSTTPAVQTPSPVPEGGLYVAGVHVRADGSQVPLEAVPDELPPDRRIPVPPQRTPPTVPQEAPDAETTPTIVGISALRLFVGDDAGVGNLTLEFDRVQGRAENKLGTVAVQACPPEYFWTPDEGGPIESAPKPDCSQGLAYGEDTGPTVQIPVGGLVRNGWLDVVLMPQPGSAFHAVFKKPGSASIEVIRYPTSDGGGEPFEAFPFIPGPACDCPLGEVPVLASTGTFDPSVVFNDAPAYEVRAPAPGRSRQVLGGRDGRLISESVPELTTWQKAMAGGILALLVAFYLLLLRSPGGLTLAFAGRRADEQADAVRGIGRFARPRTGPNPRL